MTAIINAKGSDEGQNSSGRGDKCKWLLYGHRGWIGSKVVELLKTTHTHPHTSEQCTEKTDDSPLLNKKGVIHLPDTRVDDVDQVIKDLNDYQPDRVICLIGRTNGPGFDTIDYLEQKGKLYENIRDNLFGPLILAELCRARNIHLTYLGTGCIFNYDDEHPMPKENDDGHFVCSRSCFNNADSNVNGNDNDNDNTNNNANINDNDKINDNDNANAVKFKENDLPNYFDSSYSIVKGFTDRFMHLYPNVLNVRIRMPISSQNHPRNFISKITKYRKVINVPNSMSVLEELLPIMLKCSEAGETGTLNLCNPGVISHNEILNIYKLYVDPNFYYENFTQEELLAVTACGRSNNALCTERLESLANKYHLPLKNIRDAIISTLTAASPP